jgi:hypothetical protein
MRKQSLTYGSRLEGTGRTLLLLTACCVALLLWGCDDDKQDVIIFPTDGVPPAEPQGVFSVTGDTWVDIFWIPNTEADLEGYGVYRSLDPVENYVLIEEVGIRPDPESGLISYTDQRLTNGTTYYYGITAFDEEGLESDFNVDLIFDTPRAEGSVRLMNVEGFPGSSGFDFSRDDVVSWNDPRADIYFEHTREGYRIYATDQDPQAQTDIQDMGYAEYFDEIGWAPPEGWSRQGWVEAIEGHIYVIWTRDDHYAKIQVRSMTEDFVDLFWAYQTSDEYPQELQEDVPVRPVRSP